MLERRCQPSSCTESPYSTRFASGAAGTGWDHWRWPHCAEWTLKGTPKVNQEGLPCYPFLRVFRGKKKNTIHPPRDFSQSRCLFTEAGAGLNRGSVSGATACWMAAAAGHVEAVLFLVTARAAALPNSDGQVCVCVWVCGFPNAL